MLTSLRLNILLLITLSLVACKAWYKAGADTEELTADQQRCEDETRTPTANAFVECMERAGWHHTKQSGTATDSRRDSPSEIEVETMSQMGQRDKAEPDKTNEPTATPHSATHSTELSEDPRKPPQAREFGGWIQFGEDTDQLKDAKARCYEVGVPRRTFYECMEGQGWRPVGIGIRISVEEPGDLD